MAVTESEVRTLARLAHLALSDDEVREAAGHLARLVEYVERLQRIDVSAVPPDSARGVAAGASTPLRADLARPGLPREVVLRGAPAASAGLFEVPRVVVRSPKPAGGEPEADEVAP